MNAPEALRVRFFLIVFPTLGWLESKPRLPQQPDQHRSEHPVLLAVDKQLGEGATLGVASEFSDPVGSVEVGQHEDVEQLGAGSRPEGVQTFPESAFELIGPHTRKLRRRSVAR